MEEKMKGKEREDDRGRKASESKGIQLLLTTKVVTRPCSVVTINGPKSCKYCGRKWS
jgi:hypothetical protein